MNQAPKIFCFLKMNVVFDERVNERVFARYKSNKETTQITTTSKALTNAIGDRKTADFKIHDFFSYSCANMCNYSSEKQISYIQENLNLSNHSNLSRISLKNKRGAEST